MFSIFCGAPSIVFGGDKGLPIYRLACWSSLSLAPSSPSTPLGFHSRTHKSILSQSSESLAYSQRCPHPVPHGLHVVYIMLLHPPFIPPFHTPLSYAASILFPHPSSIRHTQPLSYSLTLPPSAILSLYPIPPPFLHPPYSASILFPPPSSITAIVADRQGQLARFISVVGVAESAGSIRGWVVVSFGDAMGMLE